MIDTHHELVLALSEAAELEHSLICQYLFAAYSLKTDPAVDGITADEASRFLRWQEAILNVARQEMGHLGTVWNLSALTGAQAHTTRANLPQESAKYYPPAIGFALEPFGRAALERFIEFERPMPQPKLFKLSVAPDPIKFIRVGDLYRQIRVCIETLDEKQLLINVADVQDSESWSNNVTLKTATTRQEALDAIDFIIEEGEGHHGNPANSHFSTFTTILDELQQHLAAGGSDPARPCVANLATQKHRDAPNAVIIDEPSAVRAVDLFNLLYGSLLHLLRQYYAFAGETEEQRLYLQNAAYRTMHGCLGPLGRALSLVPAWKDGSAGTAGPSFELYGFDALATRPATAWPLFAQRMRLAETEAADLATTLGPTFTAVARVAGKVAKVLEDQGA